MKGARLTLFCPIDKSPRYEYCVDVPESRPAFGRAASGTLEELH